MTSFLYTASTPFTRELAVARVCRFAPSIDPLRYFNHCFEPRTRRFALSDFGPFTPSALCHNNQRSYGGAWGGRERPGHSQWVPLNLAISRYGTLSWLSRDVLRPWIGLYGSRSLGFLPRLYITRLQCTSRSPRVCEMSDTSPTQHTDAPSSFSLLGGTDRNSCLGNCRVTMGANCQA